MQAASDGIEISVILPMYREEQNVRRVLDQVIAAVEPMGARFEVVAVDDGSSDGTLAELKRYAHPALRWISLRRNFGQTAALQAGFDASRGEILVTLDADLQNDPRDIPMLLETLRASGADMVSGERDLDSRVRNDGRLRTYISRVANWIISRVTGVKLSDYGCTLKVYRRAMVKEVRLYGEMHRFIPALCVLAGARVEEIRVRHNPRQYGTSKYGWSRTLRVILDLITVKFLLSFGTRPLHMFGAAGILGLGLGSLILVYLAFVRVVLQEPIADRPLLLAGVLLVLVGFQFISMGLISELLVRIYHESSARRTYIVREQLEAPGRHDPDPAENRAGVKVPGSRHDRDG